jgi:protein ImuA
MAKHGVARETLFFLRREIARIEGVLAETLASPGQDATILRRGSAGGKPCSAMLATGAEHFDAALGGGLPDHGLTEIHGPRTCDAGAVAGFVLALAGLALERDTGSSFLWIGTAGIFRENGFPYAPGIFTRFGIGAERTLVSTARKLEDALWIAEEAAGIKALSAIFLEIEGNPGRLGLTATRRLHRRALTAGRPVFLVREAALSEPTAAPVRLLVAPAPALSRSTLDGPLDGSIGPPAFAVSIDKNRRASLGKYTLEWNPADRTFRERWPESHVTENIGVMVPASSDRPHMAPTGRPVLVFRRQDGQSTAPRQPPREQYKTHSRARQAG